MGVDAVPLSMTDVKGNVDMGKDFVQSEIWVLGVVESGLKVIDVDWLEVVENRSPGSPKLLEAALGAAEPANVAVASGGNATVVWVSKAVVSSVFVVAIFVTSVVNVFVVIAVAFVVIAVAFVVTAVAGTACVFAVDNFDVVVVIIDVI